MSDVILVINAGSSSIKYGIYADDKLECLHRENIPIHHKEKSRSKYEDIFKDIFNSHDDYTFRGVGHRIVHGGTRYSTPINIDDDVLKYLHTLSPLAPLHQEHNLLPVEIIRQLYPGTPQIACFDTAFHRSQPLINQLYALPRQLSDEGIIRYGFHGLSYEHIAAELPNYSSKANGKVIVAHLGSGASMCAMKNRESVASTMGFTALDGLMMATRCGALDPGVVLYLMQQKKLRTDKISDILYQQSGLLGVSGISDDMQDLAESEEPDAQTAVDLFCHYAIRSIGQLVAELQGLDVLVFTAGIGEHQALVRNKITDALTWLPPFDVLTIPTDEEKIIASHTHSRL